MKTEQKIKKVRNLLREHGDNVPESDIQKNVNKKNLKNWAVLCNCKGDIIAACYKTKTDWYLWTIKNLVTNPEYRGKGYGTEVAKQSINTARKEGAKVIAADITYDNKSSQKIFKKLGFKPVNRFCWAKGKKPADILHYVLMPPTGTKCK
jgi:RimJ/RimL family protein N-acetyltransferase